MDVTGVVQRGRDGVATAGAEPTRTLVLAAVAARAGSTARELALACVLGLSTVGKTLVSLESEGLVVRTPGGRHGSRLAPDRWTAVAPPDDAEPSPTPTPAAPRASSARELRAAQSGPTSTRQGERLQRGELPRLVLDYLTEHRGQAATASAVGTALRRSGGAVANALARLAASGDVVQVCDRPRRYRATGD